MLVDGFKKLQPVIILLVPSPCCRYILWSSQTSPNWATCSPSPTQESILLSKLNISVKAVKRFSNSSRHFFYPTLFTKKYGGDEIVVDGFKNMQLLGRDMGLEPCGFAPRSSKYYSVLQYCFLSFSNSSCHLNW